jgi:site-specific DNA-methyltransferase (adenine-specific)
LSKSVQLEPSPPPSAAAHPRLPAPVFDDPRHHIRIYQGDCLAILAALPEDSVDLVFADPPYFLSNGGITCHAGKMVSVNKGAWDRSRGPDANHEFNRAWLAACQRVLKPNGTIWVSGTSHVIHSVGFAMQQLGFKLLNDISWVKPNPPPNLSCRYFTHATETIIWAAKSARSKHTFHYQEMKQLNGGKQMKSVWTIRPPALAEKRFGKHPAQKPLALLERVLLAASNPGDWLLDPFMGAGTSAIVAARLSRRVIAVDSDHTAVTLAMMRICAELVQVRLSIDCFEIVVDLYPRSMDRSVDGSCSPLMMQFNETMVHRDRKYHFVGVRRREVIFSTSAATLEEAWERFKGGPQAGSPVIFVIKAETEIYLADQT